jgi:hypothetical protein
MKDSYPESRSSHLSSCPLSAECVALLDVLEALAASPPDASSRDDINDTEVQQRAAQLLVHLRSCAACQQAVAQARSLRERLRNALRAVMDEAEIQVPSTSSAIMLALRREQQKQPASGTLLSQPLPTTEQESQLLTIPSQTQSLPSSTQLHIAHSAAATEVQRAALRRLRARKKRALSYGAFLVAAAVILLTAVSVFHFAPAIPHSSSGVSFSHVASSSSASSGAASSQKSSTLRVPSVMAGSNRVFAVTNGWSAVLLTQRSSDGRSQLVENYNPTTDRTNVLLMLPLNAVLDGISHQGNNLIYHQYDARHNETTYSLLHGIKVSLSGNDANAVWSTDDASMFVATHTGDVWQIDASGANGVLQHLALHTGIDQLLMTRDNYLYFSYGHTLYRTSITGNPAGSVQQLVTGASQNSFWLNPYTNNDLYYYRQSSTGSNDLYTAPVDAPKQERLLASATTLIGYGDPNTNTLIGLRYNQQNGRFELVSIDKASGNTHLLSDQIAPGAQALCQNTSAAVGVICGESVALSPLPENQALIFGARYAGGQYRVEYSTVMIPSPRDLALFNGQPVQFIGWDKLAVP